MVKTYPEVHGGIAEFLDREFHGIFKEQLFEPTVPANMGTVLPADPERVSAIFINQSVANSVIIRPVPGGGLAGGIILTTTVPVFSCNVREHGILPALEWFARGGAAGDLIVITVRREVRIPRMQTKEGD